jgi:putative endonuclease
MSSQTVGVIGENLARDFLIAQGYVFVTANYRTRWGELDLVMRHRGQIVFVEVKTRRRGNEATPNDELSWYKLRRLEAAAQLYCQTYQVLDWRMEAVAVTIDKTKNIATMRLIRI